MSREEMVPSWRKKRYGRCRICQKFGRLTREHIPPASAFNQGDYRQYYVEQTEAAEVMQWKSREVNANGIFVFSLCKKCNEKTGRAYASAYADFVQSFSKVAIFDNVDQDVEVEFKSLFPSRIAKQVVSMMLSTSMPSNLGKYTAVWNPHLRTEPSSTTINVFGERPDMERWSDIYDQLRTFVRKRTVKGLPSGVRLYTYATANQGSGVQTGILGNANLTTQKTFWGVVVGLWPIQWLLTFEGEPDMQLLDVTEWADDDYKTKRKLTVRLPCRWTIAKYPLDFRTPEKYMKDGFIARMRHEGYIPEPKIDEEQLFTGAIAFARSRGTLTSDGIFLKQFHLGTYAEYKNESLWFEGKRVKEVREFIKNRLVSERALEGQHDHSSDVNP